MKKMDELILPEDVKYTTNHEWVKKNGDSYLIGITDFAQDQLGDIVYVELPEVGARFEQNEIVSTVESVKAVAEVYMPISGEIIANNENLNENPVLINSDPYNQGWIIQVTAEDTLQIDKLLNKEEYRQQIEGEE